MKNQHDITIWSKNKKRLLATLFCLCLIASNFMQASTFAQSTVTATFKDVTLNEVIWEIQKQTGFTFIYSTNDVKKVKIEDIKVNKERISDVLDKCLKNSGLTYSVHQGVIAIKKAPPSTAASREKYTIIGSVTESNGDPIIGANIAVKGTPHGTVT
ncbi:MAG: secretin and TonB N-terminal domain-containing protein, partial [Phocaeicola sp.]|nr:secretin and TonB N-terminal domain-containing protein [Phocaeicola sp.]